MSVDVSPTARALRTLELLQARGDATAVELAGALGVTARAVRRYVAILREAGVPIESTPGRQGGYRLGRGTKLPPVTFTPPENLDPVAVLEEHLGTGWQFPTRVAFDAPVSAVAPYITPPMGRLEATNDGCVLVGTTRNPTMYAQEWLANVPIPFRVEAGEELRAAVATLAARLADAVSARP